ncbi:uncharacterized protein [Musca autumnalis]|uniref:uncharacterized protein n=1 Tax=Musca autumnalis TaxID=221902 RepID=UPI003CEE9EE1
MAVLNRLTILFLLAIVSSIQADFQLKSKPVYIDTQTFLELKSTEVTESGEVLNHYICTAGKNKTESIACTSSSSNSWKTEQNLQLTDSCSARKLTYVEIHIIVSSTQNVACSISSGQVEYTQVELTVNIWGTHTLNYTALFYEN